MFNRIEVKLLVVLLCLQITNESIWGCQMNWRKENNILVLETGKKIEFDFAIKGVEDLSQTTGLRVQLDVPKEKSGIENVYLSTKDGVIVQRHIIKNLASPKIAIDEDLAIPQECTMNWAKKDNILIINDEKPVSFDYPIGVVFETCGILLLVLDVPSKQSMTENVFAVSKEGRIFWQIERIIKTSHPVNCYIGVSDSRIPGIVVAYNWNCTNVYVDIKTGKVVDTEFTK